MTFLLLIFGFILIEMPIVAFLSVVNDVHQPLLILIMALICTVIDVFIITNRITFHKANGGNEERMRKIRKAVKITAIIIAVCLLPGTWFVSEEGYRANRKKGSSYDYNYSGSHSSYDLRIFGSSRGKSSSSSSSDQHDDADSDDTSSSDSDRTSYYPTQKPQVNQKITNGVEDYDDPDDYASDYAEEFAYDEFGDDESEEAYDYGYEEAYDYWMDERGDDESD